MPTMGVIPIPPATRRYSGRPTCNSNRFFGAETESREPGLSDHMKREPPRLCSSRLTATR